MIKKYLVNLSKKNVWLRKIFRFLIYVKNKIMYSYYYLFYKVSPKMILFESFYGNSYSCSPKAIYEYMLTDERFNDFTFVWAFKEPNKYSFDKRTILVKSNSRRYYKYLSKSKYWIVNLLINTGVKKKKNQVYVQCWHGTPLKKLRYDIEKDNILNSVSEVRKRNDLDAIKFDYFISPSKFCTEKFTSAFNLKNLNKENIFIEKGYPRNDYLFNYKKSDVKKIKKKLNIPLNKKVILYAPTFRDNQVNENGYTYNVVLDFEKLKKEISDEYVVLFRAHYFIANKFNFDKYNGFVYNVSKYEDINELYIISDLLITDYSSVFFDFANLKRPELFYMYDYDDYKNNLRDFYISLKELPGPIVQSEEELIGEIKKIDSYNKKYKIKYENFNKKYNYLDDGNSAKRVVEEIFNENRIKKEN